MFSVFPDPLPTNEDSAWACSLSFKEGTAQQASSSDCVVQNLRKGRGKEIQEVLGRQGWEDEDFQGGLENKPGVL